MNWDCPICGFEMRHSTRQTKRLHIEEDLQEAEDMIELYHKYQDIGRKLLKKMR